MLIVAVLLAGLTVCPHGALSCCTVAMQASHHCCGNGVQLKEVNCCGRNGRPDQTVASAMISQPDTILKYVAAMPAPVLTRAARRDFVLVRLLDYGPAPPETPYTRHTSLLL